MNKYNCCGKPLEITGRWQSDECMECDISNLHAASLYMDRRSANARKQWQMMIDSGQVSGKEAEWLKERIKISLEEQIKRDNYRSVK